MKISFNGLIAPTEFDAKPPPKLKVFEGEELEEVYRRMKKWLKDNACD